MINPPLDPLADKWRVVGGSAPALSETNKGRQMLEKMGYKAGSSLGAGGETGIIEPICGVLRPRGAGLGFDFRDMY